MGWSWPDLTATSLFVIEEAFRLMEDTETERASEAAAAELRLKALKSAKKARGRR